MVISTSLPPQTSESRAKQQAILKSGIETFRSSGGGSRRLSSKERELLEGAKERERRLSAEIKRKELEQKRKEAIKELEEKRQERIQSGKISGQLQTKVNQTNQQRQKSFATKTKDFFFTAPRFNESLGRDVGVVEGGFNLVKTFAFQPLAGISQELKKSGKEIKKQDFKGSKAIGTTIGGVGTLIPETPAGQLVLIGGAKAISVAPKVVRIGVGGVFGATGTKGALNPSLSSEERVASGIVGSLAITGTTFETIPFARGLRARTSPSFKPVGTQPEGFKAVELGQGERIGFILEKSPAKTGATTNVNLPKTSPLVRGGFGVKPQEKSQFLGTGQVVATSQQGLFKQGKNVVFEREFFVSPQEPNIKIPETRLSRLGLEDPLKFQKNTEIGFGFPKQPQIGIERGATISRTEKGGSYRIGTGTELEGIKSAGTITNIKRIGRTTVKGQGVDIFEFKTSSTRNNLVDNIVKRRNPTTRTSTRVSGEVVLGSSLGFTSRQQKTRDFFGLSNNFATKTSPTPRTPDIFKPTSPFIPRGSSSISSFSSYNPSLPYGSSSSSLGSSIITPTRKLRSLGGLDKGKSKGQRFRQITRYQSSVTSSVFGITSTKVPTVVGVSVRPIVVSEKKRERPRKKVLRRMRKRVLRKKR